MNKEKFSQFLNSRQRYSSTITEEIGFLKHLHENHSINPQNVPRKVMDKDDNNSSLAIILGFIALLTGVLILAQNEIGVVNFYENLDESLNSIVEVFPTYPIDAELEGQVIMVTGPLSVRTPLQDSYYGIRVKAVALKRRVQMFQWIEEESLINEGLGPIDVSYSYSKAWKDKLVDSLSFRSSDRHQNPVMVPVPNVIQVADVVQIGYITLSAVVKGAFTQFSAFSGDDQPASTELKLHHGMYYLTKDIFSPEIEDIRVQFYYAGHEGNVVTVIGRLVGHELHSYVSSSGKEMMIVRPGEHSLEQMIVMEHSHNGLIVWFKRLIAWVLIYVGMETIVSFARYFVYVSKLAREAVYIGSGYSPFYHSVFISLLLISGAWSLYRPAVSFCLFATSLVPFACASIKKKNNRLISGKYFISRRKVQGTV